jgi:CBS domain-containing protein
VTTARGRAIIPLEVTMARIDRHMTRDVLGLEATAPCRDAARLMAEKKVGAVAVRAGGSTIGLVTERDLTRVLSDRGHADLAIGEAMRRDLPSVLPTATELDCARLMRDHNTRHLLVAEGGRIVGIVSMRDVIQLMLDEKQTLIDQLQAYIYEGR